MATTQEGSFGVAPQGGEIGTGQGLVGRLLSWKTGPAKPQLKWSEPRWAYVPRMIMEARDSLFNKKSFTRIRCVTVVVSAVIIGACKWAFPQIVVPNLWPVAAAPALILLYFATVIWIAPGVTILPEKNIVECGSGRIDARSITEAYLTFHAEDRIRLRLHFTWNNQPRRRVIGVPLTVDFRRLMEMLPVTPIVRDARHRSLRRGKIEAAGTEDHESRSYELSEA